MRLVQDVFSIIRVRKSVYNPYIFVFFIFVCIKNSSDLTALVSYQFSTESPSPTRCSSNRGTNCSIIWLHISVPLVINHPVTIFCTSRSTFNLWLIRFRIRAGNICLFIVCFTCKMRVNRSECHCRSVISQFSQVCQQNLFHTADGFHQNKYQTVGLRFYFAFITRHANCIRIATDVTSYMGWLAVRYIFTFIS
jgi:hypothetical protein